jgi:hypothetical protein
MRPCSYGPSSSDPRVVHDGRDPRSRALDERAQKIADGLRCRPCQVATAAPALSEKECRRRATGGLASAGANRRAQAIIEGRARATEEATRSLPLHVRGRAWRCKRESLRERAALAVRVPAILRKGNAGVADLLNRRRPSCKGTTWRTRRIHAADALFKAATAGAGVDLGGTRRWANWRFIIPAAPAGRQPKATADQVFDIHRRSAVRAARYGAKFPARSSTMAVSALPELPSNFAPS